MSKDYYAILGVDKAADDQEIKRGFRKMAQKYHPDRNRGNKEAETKFKEVNEAYEVLSDRQKRGQYDQFGGAGPDFSQNFQGRGFDFSGFGNGGFADIFESFFGGQQQGRSQAKSRGKRGNDIETTIAIPFLEAVFGAEKELEITKPDTCSRCKGAGAEPGAKIKNCPRCQGAGVINQVRQTILGQIQTSSVCGECRGEGRIPEKKCGVCHGGGRERKTGKIKMRIPAGIEDNSTIRVTGKGEAGIQGGEPGDLFIHIQVRTDKDFKRRGNDIFSDLHIDLLQAVLGAEVEVKTVYGPVKLKIPGGTQSGKVFKLADYGVTGLNSNQKGHHFAQVIVEIPTKLSRKEKDLYLQLAAAKGLEVKTGKDGLFGLFGS